MKDIFNRLKVRPIVMIEIIAASCVINTLALTSTFYTILVLNKYVSYGVDATLYSLTAGAFIALLLEVVLRHARTGLIQSVIALQDWNQAKYTFGAVLESKQTALDTFPAGFVNHALGSLKTYRSAYNAVNLAAILDGPFALVFLLIVFLISPPLAGVLLAAMTALLLLTFFSGLGEHERQELKHKEAINGAAITSTMGWAGDTIKAFNAKEPIARSWMEHLDRTLRQELGQLGKKSLSSSGVHFLTVGLAVATMAIGAMQVVALELDVGALIGVNVLSARAFQSMTKVIMLREVFEAGKSSKRDQDYFLRTPKEKESGVVITNFTGRIAFKDVSLTFPAASAPILESLDLELGAGEVLAITGRNGSGKTSLCKMLLGLLEPNRGQILIDGADLKQLNLGWWRSQIQYLPQEPTFLNGALLQNIQAVRPGIEDQELAEAAHNAGVKDLIERHKDGFEMPITNLGRDLSLGVRRRLALMRALTTKGQLVVFDEPAEGMDADGANAVYGLLTKLHQEGHTIIVAGNDPNILQAAHWVLNLDQKPVPHVISRENSTI